MQSTYYKKIIILYVKNGIILNGADNNYFNLIPRMLREPGAGLGMRLYQSILSSNHKGLKLWSAGFFPLTIGLESQSLQ